jgi:ribonucleoside-diphosphate reductase alpha chain
MEKAPGSSSIGVRMFSESAKHIFELHYQARDKRGKLVEHCPEDVIRRVCGAYHNYMQENDQYPDNGASMLDRLQDLQMNRVFSFNSPLYYNFGVQENPVLGACYVAHLEDSIKGDNGIADTLGRALYIFKSGAGIGVPIWLLRPRGASLGDGGVNIQGKTGSSGSVSWMDTLNVCGETVKAAGKRRAGIFVCMPVWHPDIIEFITIKSTEQRNRFLNMNLSVIITTDFMDAVEKDLDWQLKWRDTVYPITRDYTGPNPKNGPTSIKARKLLRMIAEASWKSGDPGMLFLDEVNKFNLVPSLGSIDSANVCVTGDTLAAVADGRNYVPMKQLAEEGKDVLVHCVDPATGEALVRTGRNPRLTRRGVPVFKVTLDDGSYIRTTGDHKFLRSDGSEVKCACLVPGDRLRSFIKYQQPNTTTGRMYWNVISRGTPTWKWEHALIADVVYGPRIGDQRIHHTNGNSLDNRSCNLEMLTISEHNKRHPSIVEVRGEKNPMFGKRHSREAKRKIGDKTKERCESLEYKAKLSSSIRKGMETGRLKLMGERVPRTVVPCLTCGEDMKLMPWQLAERERGEGHIYCSKACWAATRRVQTPPEDVVAMGVDCAKRLGKLTDRTWTTYNTINPERPSVNTLKNMFGSFKKFKSACMEFVNHRVLSVQPDGVEDVYNITVDDVHTIAYITNTKAKTKFKGRHKLWGLYTANCGEQTLNRDTSCNLGAINLHALASMNGYQHLQNSRSDFLSLVSGVAREVLPFLDMNVDITSYPDERFENNSKFARNVGLGISGFGEMLAYASIPYDSLLAQTVGEQIMQELTLSAWEWGCSAAKTLGHAPCFDVQENQDAYKRVMQHYSSLEGADTERWGRLIEAADAGTFPRNSNVTTIAPTGNTGFAFDTGTGGCEPIFALAYKKEVTGGKTLHMFDTEFEKYVKDHDLDISMDDVVAAHGRADKLDKLPDEGKQVFRTAREIGWQERVRVQAALQKFCTSAISSTVNLPEETPVETVLDIYKLAYKMGCKGITLYRPGWVQGVMTTGGEKRLGKKPKRPIRLSGDTFKIKLAMSGREHKVYVTINQDTEGDPVEVFVNIGDSGSELQAWAQALGRLISLGLQVGIKPGLIVKHVIGIHGSMYGWTRLSEEDEKPISIKSGPAVVGHLIKRHYVDKEEAIEEIGADLCPQCQARAFVADRDGCWHCKNCDYSRGCGG